MRGKQKGRGKEYRSRAGKGEDVYKEI